jgi:CRP/FNR family transcriptional regulator, cyclic AMP receptor protein
MPGLFNYDDPSADVFTEHTAILSDLTDAEWDLLIGCTERKLFPAGTPIVRTGEKDRAIYIIVSGEVDVIMHGPKGAVQLSTLTEGSVFGEVAFFDGEPRSADVVARGAVEVLCVRAERIDQLVCWHPRLAHKVVMELGRVVSQRLRRASKGWAMTQAAGPCL